MIHTLSLEDINSVAPYKVESVGDNSVLYTFVTDSGVELAIDFMDDDLITSAESYQLVISNVNNKRSPRDSKVQKTILAIVTEFFEKNQAALLYICETGDGKQLARYRLFSYWFDKFDYSLRFTCLSTSIEDEDGIPNAATLFIRNDNPQLNQIISDFNETVRLLRSKPKQ